MTNLPNHQKKADGATALCIECGGAGRLVTGAEVYPHRPDLHSLYFYRCTCGARVGCHRGTKTALGYCAGPETQKARMAAHRVFDPLWKAKQQKGARKKAYLWLAEQLGIEPEDCHISHMDVAMARRVYAICEPIYQRIRGKT